MYLSVLPFLHQLLCRFCLAQRAVLVGEQHRAHPERPACPSVQMHLDGGKDAFQHRCTQLCAVQNVKAGIGGGGIHQGGAHLMRGTAQRRMGAKHFSAAIRRVGVGVHDPCRQLAELAHVAYQKHFLKFGRGSHIQRIPDEVGGLDHREPLELRQSAGQIIQPVVAGGQHQPPGAWGIFVRSAA